MVNGITPNLGAITGTGGATKPAGAAGTGSSSFADVLKGSIDEVSRMEADASKAVDDLASGKSEDVTGVMTAMEKSDLAFKTLLAIRTKLMDAYSEIKSIPI